MSELRYPYMIRVKTDDEAVLYCLRAISMYAQAQGDKKSRGNVYKVWKGTGGDEWEDSDGEVTFRFTSLDRRNLFEEKVKVHFPQYVTVKWRNPE